MNRVRPEVASPTEVVVPNVAAAPAPGPAGAFAWSVRKELWDHPILWTAPLITAAWVFLMFLTIMVIMARPGSVPALPYDIAPGFVLLATAVVWVFYGVDALYGERRDRSILFWKSLPVSDRTAVLSKAAILLVVSPLIAFTLIVALQFGLWLAHKATGIVVGVSPMSAGPFELLRTCGSLAYGLAALTLWLAPIHAWTLLVSAWARRAPLVWAVVPFIVLRVMQQSPFLREPLSHVTDRWIHWTERAYAFAPRAPLPIDPRAEIAPMKFLGSAGLWIGIAVAALFLFLAIRTRRERGSLG